MITFSYTALNPSTGKKISAEIEADNEQSAAKLLISQGLAPLEIAPKHEQSRSKSFRNRITTKQKVIFSRQLSTLIDAGLPLLQSLSTVKNQTKNPGLRDVIAKVSADVEGGSSLSEALSKHPNVFDNVYINLVAAGEASGSLDVSLERIANQQEKDAEIMSKIRGAMVYPAIVVVVLFGILIFMTTTVLPQVSEVYKGIPGASLPLVTTLLLAFSKLVISFWWLAIIILIGAIFFIKRYLKTKNGQIMLDKLKIRLWPIAPLFMKIYMARFSRTAAILVGSGVPIVKVLDTTADAVGNSQVADSIRRAVEQVKGGKTLSSSLQGDPNFLDLVPDMISIGEQSGSLETMLGRVADYYEKEVETQVKSINTIIEPMLMIVVGVAALIIVAAVLLPIYGLAGKNIGV